MSPSITKKPFHSNKTKELQQLNMKSLIFLGLFIAAQCKPYLRESQDNFDVVCPESTDGLAVFVPHPYDCGLYYECVGTNPVLMSCPGGLYFDPSLNVCNWPDQVDCEPSTEQPETTVEQEQPTTPAAVAKKEGKKTLSHNVQLELMSEEFLL